MIRAVTSVLPPAAKPTISLIGFAGQAVWAYACPHQHKRKRQRERN